MDIANIILYKAKISEALYAHLSASMIFPTWKTRLKKNFLLGQIFHIGIGSLMGLPLVYVLKKTGKDHHIFKGIITGFGTWGLVHDVGIRMGLFRLRPGTTGSYYSTLIQNLIFGIISAHSIVTLADPNMFPENKIVKEKNEVNHDYSIVQDNESSNQSVFIN